MKHLRIFIFTLLCISAYGLSHAATTHESTMTVSVDVNSKGMGLVAVQAPKSTFLGSHTKPSQEPSYPNEYSEEAFAEYSFTTSSSSGVNTYYLFAVPNEGYEFDYWEGSSNFSSTDAKSTFTCTHYSGKTPYTVRAHFRKSSVVKLEENPAGKINLSIDGVETGEMVTATVELYEVEKGKNINMMSYFSHWEDGDGNWLSDDIEYTFEARPMTLRAVIKSKGAAPGEVTQKIEAGKYYRVRNAYNRVLTIAGNFKQQLSANNLDVSTSLLRWALPLDYDETKFNPGSGWNLSDAYEPVCPEATPGTIFYIEKGTQSGDNLKNVRIVGQGVNTYDITGYELTVSPIEKYFGYFTINASVKAFIITQDVIFKAIDRGGYGTVNVSTPNSDPMVAMAIQPIDEEHVDDFWFGALPEEGMEYDGGYWTSMYTAFPYRVYEPDGVEIYYVKESIVQDNVPYALLTKVEDGRVPANTGVLLKCKSLDSKGNRLLPLPTSENIPDLEGNVLAGEFQLYSDASKNGRKKFDESTMRVFGKNSNGDLGFFKLKAGADGSPAELKANKAYIDMTKFPTEISALSLRLGTVDDMTGVESVVVGDNNDNEVIYDLMGRVVTHPVSGTIYIANGKKVIL